MRDTMSTRQKTSATALSLLGAILLFSSQASAAYKATKSRNLKRGEIAVTQPGSYAQARKTYVLTRDITSATTPIFLGKNVTFDLNGHTITFAKGNYLHVPNSGFEDGLKHWDTSKAPNARVLSKTVLPFVGEKILQLPQGEEIVSEYIILPVANRSYYATCAIGHKQRITINVEDKNGNPVRCTFQTSQANVGCPVQNASPVFGGGTIFAHLHNLPAGQYRIRVKAMTKGCLIDEVDILPAFDSGIAIVGAIKPYANYTAMRKWHPCAFFDFNKNSAAGAKGQKKAIEPLETIPLVKGSGTITIKNGIIRNGTELARSYAIHSNARDVKLVLENLMVVNSGLNANSASLPKADIKHCRFEIDTPFIINRHDQSAMSVSVDQAVEIAHNEFIGGQGNLRIGGKNARIHHNLFINQQTVTNHYSVSSGGTGNKIYNNRFEPKQGSGIYFGGRNNELYNNTFKIASAPPCAEYRYKSWSTNAIRLSDYNSPRGKGVSANRVYQNKIYITGKAYPQYKGYRPATHAVHYSCGGGVNYIYDNEVFVKLEDKGSKVRISAFFISGATHSGGEWYNNKITSNVPHIWIAAPYGPARFDKIYNNTFIKAKDAQAGMKPIRMGSRTDWNEATATDIEFYSNVCQGFAFGIDATRRKHIYAVGWTLTVKVLDKRGKAAKAVKIIVADQDGKEIASALTNDQGQIVLRLPEYRVVGGKKTTCSSYVVQTGDQSKSIRLTKDTQMTIRQ